MSTIFRLKFAYKYESETGEIKKGKKELFAECINYTDAESLAMKIAELNDWERWGKFEYEVIKTKYTDKDFLDNHTLVREDENIHINGLHEHFFSEENDGFFIVKAKFLSEDDNGNPKSTTQAFVVTDHSINKAIDTLKNYLNKGIMAEVIITDSKLDPADGIYLTPITSESLLKRYEA